MTQAELPSTAGVEPRQRGRSQTGARGASADAPVLEVRSVSKSFGPNRVLNDISLTIRSGEFVGLMGPNGAGKSTLIKIIDGMYTPDTGSVLVNGLDASRHPELVGVVHQDLGLVESMTVLENLCLGRERQTRAVLRHPWREWRWAAEQLEAVGLARISPNRMLSELSPGEKTLVAVARLLARGSQLIIIDESTSTLPPREADWLLAKMRATTIEGTAVLMVSHKLSEIVREADRQVVIADGVIAFDSRENLLGVEELAKLVSPNAREHTEGSVRRAEAKAALTASATASADGAPVISFSGVWTAACGPLDLELKAGEVIGITGSIGSGLYDIAHLAAGDLKPVSGTVTVRPGTRIAFVPPHRESQAVFPQLSVLWNLTVSSLSRWRTRIGLLAESREREAAAAVADQLALVPRGLGGPQEVLSGGNQQKVVFGRGVLQQANCFILCEPTRGVDIAARREIYELVHSLQASGVSAIVVSSDTEDLMQLADRIAVIEDGKLSQFWDTEELTADQVLRLS